MQSVLSFPEDFVCVCFCVVHRNVIRDEALRKQNLENITTMFYCKNYCSVDFTLMLNYCRQA
jgi:hypothetical protein